MTKSKKDKPLKPPPEPNPWDILPTRDRGDDEPQALYLSVAKALTAWEFLDSAQGILFGVLVNSRAGSAESAYGMVISPASRADMVLAAASCLFAPGEPLLEEIETTVNQIRQMAGRRNDIAHGVINTHRPLLFKSDGSDSLGWFISPTYNNTRRSIPHAEKVAMAHADIRAPSQHFHRYAYVSEQVDWYASHFTAQQERMRSLYRRVDQACKERWPPPEHRAQELQKTIDELQAQIALLKRELPAEPSEG